MPSDELINATSRALSTTLFANHPQAPFDLERKIRTTPPSASDILQLVVDIPGDEDLIWLAYQDEEPSGDDDDGG